MSAIRPPERRQLTVMLCDLVGWTALSQRLDAEELTEFVQAYREHCTNVITGHDGVVAQYVGDAILAYFGYPRAHEDDAERAIRAALAIVGAPRSAASGSGVHIGIATGMVVVGNLATDAARLSLAKRELSGEAISAVGSALNLAARLQGLAEPGMIVVSEQTRRLAGAIFDYTDLGRHHLKGFDAPVQAWQVAGEARVRSRFHALRASTLTPLVDRQAELDKLRQAWASVQTGRGRAVLLSGEPGVGKSRLAEMVSRHMVERERRRLWYYCSPHLQNSPLAPFIRRISIDAGIAETDDGASKLHKLVSFVPQEIDNANEFVPLLADLLSIDYEDQYPALQMSPQRKKQAVLDALMRILETVASRQPFLLVVEDLHWIDPSSEELIGVLLERLETLPALAILTARPEFEARWRDTARLVHLPLAPLERNHSIEMIELICGERTISDAAVSHIAEHTDGLPLFIEDLTRDVFELEALHGAGIAASGQRSTFSIPTTLSDSLMARLDRLGSAKRIAQVAASIGREFSYELLAKIAEWPDEDLKEQVERLVESGLLMRPDASAALGYRFKHALVRDAAYSSLLKKEQISLHARIAKTLAEEFPELAQTQPEFLAHHFEAAKDIAKAVHYLVEAAELSARRSGFVEAVAQLERGLKLLDALPATEARTRQQLRLYLELGSVNAEHRGYSAPESGAAYNKALVLCRELGDAPELFSVFSGVGAYEITRANFAQCRELGEECLSRAAQQQSRPPFVIGHRILGGTSFLTGKFVDACEHLEDALRVYDEDPSLYRGTQELHAQDHKSTVLCYLALTLTLLGRLDRGLRAAESSLSHSKSLGNIHTVNFSLCFLAAMHHIRRNSQEALKRATESLELAREQGFATWIGVSQMIRGASLVRTGEREEGLKEIGSGMKGHSGIEAAAYQPFGISLLIEGLLAVDKVNEALGALAQALAISEKTGERFYLAELLRLKGEILSRQGRPAEAEDSICAAIEVSRQQQARLLELRSVVSLCRLLSEPRKTEALREMLVPVYKWFGEGVAAPDLDDARALIDSGTVAGIRR
jgi:class 3 adenylate cyclase/tetratricopeptide (TPR) repeat protein